MEPFCVSSNPKSGVSDVGHEQLVSEALDEAVRLHRSGAIDQAAAIYREILCIDPTHPQALHLCGVIAHQRGAHELARTLILRALQADPGFAQAHNSLGAVYQAIGEDAQALASFERARSLQPCYADPLQNLGLLHERHGRLTEAIACYERALTLGERTPALLVTLALALRSDDRTAEALPLFDEALAREPAHLPALLGRAGALHCLGRYDAAYDTFSLVTEAAPASLEAWIGMGTSALDSLDTDEALRCFDRALAISPENTLAHWNRALACLTAGQLREGWREFAWRWQTSAFDSVTRHFPAPRWDSDPLDGRTLLLWREQGIADEILFCSMLGDVRDRARHCVVESDPRLVPLLRRSFPGIEVVAAGYPPHPRTVARDIDFQAPLGDLAGALRSTAASFEGAAPYLHADPGRVAYWRERLDALGNRPKVGICWRSSNRRGVRALACTELTQWVELLRTPSIDWINLQYDRCEHELAPMRTELGIDVHCFPQLDMLNDLDDTAALIGALDLVISAPTTVSILAGALGTPTWQLTSGADWHALGKRHVPWLPSVRRFYRSWQSSWPTVLEEVETALQAWMAQETQLNEGK